MLVVDLMHESELGVWKNLFTHLIHMLYASNLALVHEVDQRYVQVKMLFIFSVSPVSAFRYCLVPRFGRDGIRKFAANPSEMKKMAAHNFEDLLQVSLQLSPT